MKCVDKSFKDKAPPTPTTEMSEERECTKCHEKLVGPCKTRTTAGSWKELMFYNTTGGTLLKVESWCGKCIDKKYVCIAIDS